MQLEETTTSKNKRIAKNTIFLYTRTIVTMIISLFTSRIVLQTLGVDNFGIYNIVGGVVSMLSVVTASLSGSISRFLNFALGTGNNEQVAKVFSTSLQIQIGLASIILILGETIGIWFINNELNIPPDRMFAANWVFQFCLAGLVISIIQTPFTAAIIAHEEMKYFAYISIVDVILKLVFVSLLWFISGDKLIVYSILIFGITVISFLMAYIYSKKKFKECKLLLTIEKPLLKEMGSFAGLAFLGTTSYMFTTQGVNIVVNMFFGVALNAARGIVTQVEGAILQFVNNFTTAFTPQITKSVASQNIEYMSSLVCRGAKFTMYLYFIFAIPISLEIPYILNIWLTDVPPMTSSFIRLSMIGTSVTILGQSSLQAILASGKIKLFEILISAICCLAIPLCWLFFKLGSAPQTAYIVYIGIFSVLMIIRLIFMKRIYNFDPNNFFKNVIRPTICVMLLGFIPGIICLQTLPSSFCRLILVCSTSFIWISYIIIKMGLNKNEKNIITNKLKKLIPINIF